MVRLKPRGLVKKLKKTRVEQRQCHADTVWTTGFKTTTIEGQSYYFVYKWQHQKKDKRNFSKREILHAVELRLSTNLVTPVTRHIKSKNFNFTAAKRMENNKSSFSKKMK